VIRMRGGVAVLAVAILCAFASPTSAQWCEEEVFLTVGDGSIEIYHSQAEYNCCGWTDIEVVRDGFTIEVFEWEQFEYGPCYCLCCFDIQVFIGGLDPGDYTLTVWKTYNNFDGTWTYESAGTWIVPVDGVSEPVVLTNYIPCADTGALDEPLSWGTIKALYR